MKGYIFKYSNAKVIAEQAEKEKQLLDSLELATYNHKLDSIFNNYNRQLLNNPYNTSQKIMDDYTRVDSNKNDREYSYNNNLSTLKFNFERLNNIFERELKQGNPTEYCRIYYTQYPEKKIEADKKYLECRCNFPIREDFDFKFINNNLYGCNCRENDYRKNNHLFTNKNEFDTFFDKGDDILKEEVEKRTALKYLTVNSQLLQSMDFQKEKKESVGSALGRNFLRIATGTNVASTDYTNENETRKNILSLVSEAKSKQYYSQIMNFVIETNKKINKEWTKNGQLFESKSAFYDAYISDEYKKILKESKKK